MDGDGRIYIYPLTITPFLACPCSKVKFNNNTRRKMRLTEDNAKWCHL